MDKNIISVFKQRVLKLLKSTEVKFIIFGSRGRGDGDEYSDYDLLIITSELESKKVKIEIEEIEMEIFSIDNAIINSHVFSQEELEKLSFEPFIRNALHEGIAA